MIEYLVPTLKDLQEIIIIKNQVKEEVIKENLPIWLDGYPDDELIKEDVVTKNARILKDDNEIVCYASYHLASIEYDEDTFPINPIMSFGRLMTKVSMRKKGYAKRLISEMIQETKEKGYLGIGILVDDFNEKALNLYFEFGFKYLKTKQFPWAVLDVYMLEFKNESN